MLGWEFFVTRQVGPIDPKARRAPLARWMTGIGGTKWLDDLASKGGALDLGGNGYPCLYAVPAAVLVAVLRHGPPRIDAPPVVGENYYLPGGWIGDTNIDLVGLRSIDPLEMLQVEAWDQS
jgi:hypothetical protein